MEFLNYIMVKNMRANGGKIRNKVEVLITLQMVKFRMVFGKVMNLLGMKNIDHQREIILI